MSNDENDELLDTVVAGTGVMLVGMAMSSMIKTTQAAEVPPTENPISEPTTIITSVAWESIDYPFSLYGESSETAKFWKGTVNISSNQEVLGSITISCPGIIAPVPLLTESAYNDLLADIDDNIASSSGVIKELWENRKALALQFPSVDGFRIDWRWVPEDSWETVFSDYITAPPVDAYQWDGISIAEGNSSVGVAFFQKLGAGIVYPATTSLMISGVVVSSVANDLTGTAEYPSVISINIPSVESGEDFDVDVSLYIPEDLPGAEWAIFRLIFDPGSSGWGMEMASARIDFLSANLVSVVDGTFIPLDAPDKTYNKTIHCSAKYRHIVFGGVVGVPMPVGVYNVWARLDVWRSGIDEYGNITTYGVNPYACYNFGIVGELEVT